ncbi:MAG: exodeoxyribonuclease VII small subunit [Huintestinicola sp.]
MSFETSVRKIDDIINKLSEGEIPLDEAIELYKQGADEIISCKKELDNAKLKIVSAQDTESEVE